MTKGNLEKTGGTLKKQNGNKNTKKTGLTLPPSTIEQSTLRKLPALPEKVPAVIELPEKENTQTAAPAAARSASVSAAAAPAAASSGAAVSSSAASAASAAPKRETVTFEAPAEDAEARLRYESALEQLEALRGAAPSYTSRYDAQIRDLYEQITGRAPFRYDSASDPLYQQYRQDYIRQGQMAMRDTMGQAAALSGGYGSSYAQSVGQQQYDAYLRRLADILPETYGMALDAYNAEGERLSRQLGAAAELEKSDYERYLDALGQYNRELSLSRDDAESAYERMIYGDETAYSRAADDYARRLGADKLDYERQQDAYSRLLSLMAAGYRPSAEEYAAAGLSRKQGEALRAQLAPSSARGGSRSGKQKTQIEESKATLSGTKRSVGNLDKSLSKR